MSAPKEYKVRVGTINSGKSYETRIIAFLSLKCCLRNLEHFWVATNVEECGDFDDIVLFKKEINKKGITQLIQLKHQDVPKDITRKEILASKGKKYRDFCLEKYLDSCLKLSEEVSKQSTGNSDIIDHLKENPEMVFVLFTNRNVVRDLEFLELTKSRGELVNVTGNIYKFKTEELSISMASNDPRKSFIQKIFLYVKQPHIKKIDNEIKKVFKMLVTSLSGLDKELQLDEIVTKFLLYIEKWSKGLLGGHYPLTKTIILRKITELLLEPFIVKLSGQLVIPEEESQVKYSMWNEMIQNKDFIVINDSDQIVDDYIQSFAYKLVVQYEKLVQNCTTIKKDLMRISGNKQLNTCSEYYEYLWKTKNMPLIIVVFSQSEIKEVTKILNVSQGIFQIIILNKSKNTFQSLKSFKTFLTAMDLTHEQRTQVYSLPIKLQGRHFPSYHKLNLEMTWDLTTKDILYILCNKFNIGQIFEELPHIFVNISLKRVWLESEVLKKVTRDTFIIACVSTEHFKKFLRKTIWDSDNQVTEWNNRDNFKFNQHRILLYENVINFKDIQDFANQNKNRSIHLLSFHDNLKLEWVRSWGTVRDLKEFRTSEKYEEKPVMASDAILNLCTAKKPILICSNPGMGKSVFIDYFARNTPTDFWVFKINLTKFKTIYEDFIKETESGFNLEAAFDKILEEDCKKNLPLAKAAFVKFKKLKNIAILLDGFDEIQLNYQNWARQFIEFIIKSGYFVLITTRPVFKNDLEPLLDTFSLDLNLFTRKNQQYFLENYFSRYSGIACGTETRTLFVKSLLNAAGSNLNDHDNEFTGVPLQTLLLAEVFIEDFKKFAKTKNFLNKHFDLLYLYRHFIQKKVRIACEKYGKISEDIKQLYTTCKSFYALRLLFSEKDLSELQIDLKLKHGKLLFPHMLELLQKDGIMVAETETSVRFIHQTFAEYIAGEWIAENIKNENEIVAKRLVKATFDPKLRVVRNIFDRILAKGCPLHLAIINCQMDQVASLLKSKHFDDVDDGNRDCLHLLASWGFQHSQELLDNYPYVKRMTARDEMASVLISIPNEKLRNSKDSILSYTPIDYAIVSCSFHIANLLCLKMKNSRTWINVENLRKSFLFDCCTYYSYFSLERALINHKSIDLRLFIDEDPNSFSYVISKENTQKLKELISGSTNLNKRDKFGFTPLHVAVRSTRKEIVEILTRNGADTNTRDNSGKTPLHWSVIEGNLSILKLLLTKEADVNIVDFHKRTPLHYAIIACPQHRLEIVSQLSNTNFDIIDEDGSTPLRWAAYFGYTECVKLFLEMGVDIKQKNNALFSAAVNEHLKTADLLLSKGADINVNVDGLTPLIYSAISGHIDVLRYLLERGVDGESSVYNGRPAICWAATAGHKDIVELLLARGLNAEAKDQNGCSPLHLAVMCEHVDIVELLISKGANINAKDNCNNSALDCAVQAGYTQIASLLLSKGSEISKTTLQVAARNGHTDLIDLFVSLNVPINSTDNEGNTALHSAVNCDRREVTALLLSRGADVEAKNCRNETPLMVAVKGGHKEVTNMLLAEGADIETNRSNSETPLILSAKYAQNEITKLLILKSATVQGKVNEGKTAFHWAVCNSDTTLETLELFISKLPNLLELRNEEQQTPLILATIRGCEEIVKLLLSRNASTRAKDRYGKTALHWASSEGYEDIVCLLLQHNADLEEKDNKGMTPLILAAKEGSKEIVKLLLSKKARIEAKDQKYWTSLHWASSEGYEDIVYLLLENNSDIEEKDIDGMTPLILAAEGGFKTVVKLLLSKHASIEAADQGGFTALHWASFKGYEDIVCLLLQNNANLEGKDKDGLTPLLLATQESSTEFVKFVLSKNARIEAKDKDGWNVLHWASFKGQEDTVCLLLENNMDLEAKDNKGMTPLILAAIGGCNAVVRLLLLKNASIKANDQDGWTSLHWASFEGHEDIVCTLLQNNADLEGKDNEGTTPLILAAKAGFEATVKLLLSKNASIEVADQNGWTALHWASFKGHEDVACVLLQNNADFEVKDDEGMTPLLLATQNGFETIVKLLLSKNASKEVKDQYNMTALDWATLKGYEDIVCLLLENNVNLEGKNKLGCTPLILAAKEGFEDIVRLLLSKNANIQAADPYGWTALHWASLNGHEEIVDLLLDNNANLEGKTSIGMTPLILAAKGGSEAVVKLLLSKNAGIGVVDQDCGTALHWASFEGDDDIVCLLLENSADLEGKNNFGMTPLILAARGGSETVVELLLSKNANIEAVDQDCWTALHWASFKGHEDVVCLLLQNGADLEGKDDDGMTPLLVATQEGSEAIVKLLLSKNANIEAKDEDGWTALHWASFKGHENIVRLLLENNADLEEKSITGKTPLVLAASEGSEPIVKLLLSKNARMEAKDQDGMTALHWASAKGNIDVVCLLLRNNADLEEKDNEGSTALIHAFLNGQENVANKLILYETTVLK